MTSISSLELQEKYKDSIVELIGQKTATVSHISSIEKPQAHSLLFIVHEKWVPVAEASPCSIVLISTKLKNLIPETTTKTWLLSSNPELLMAKIKNDFFLATPYRNSTLKNRAASAIIPESAHVAASAIIAHGVVLGERVVIGDNTYIGTNSVIEADVTIGNDTTIHPLVYIGHSCVIGNRCEVMPNTCLGSEGFGYAHDERWNHYRIPHSGRVVLEDDVHIGANCSIDRGTLQDSVIGKGTKVDNQCHLAHNSVIGKNGLITAQFGMAGSSTIGNNFVSGGKASVTGHIHITDNVQIGGMSGVTKSITEAGQYGGFPLQKMQDYLKTKAALLKLSEIRSSFKQFINNTENK